MKYYIIYKVTNKITEKFYIGKHKTDNINDGYMGSGKYLRHAQEKYGIENFIKEILFVFDNIHEMNRKESEIVNEDFLACENTYNLKKGGEGGWDYINDGSSQHIERCIKAAKSRKTISGWKLTKEQLENACAKATLSLKEKYPNGTFYGKKHASSYKEHMSQKMKGRYSGEKNPNFGTRWIHSTELKQSKRIKKNDKLPLGWCEGRKIKF